eukprot:scaffold1390_cov138-Cylindrotheca_fusiformis.AAC.37
MRITTKQSGSKLAENSSITTRSAFPAFANNDIIHTNYRGCCCLNGKTAATTTTNHIEVVVLVAVAAVAIQHYGNGPYKNVPDGWVLRTSIASGSVGETIRGNGRQFIHESMGTLLSCLVEIDPTVQCYSTLCSVWIDAL